MLLIINVFVRDVLSVLCRLMLTSPYPNPLVFDPSNYRGDPFDLLHAKFCDRGLHQLEGSWVAECKSCTPQVEKCDFQQATWQSFSCFHTDLIGVHSPRLDPLLEICLQDKVLFFLGDSTLRGMFMRLLEPLVTRDEDAVPIHSFVKVHDNRTGIMFAWNYVYDASAYDRVLAAFPRSIWRSRKLVLITGGTSTNAYLNELNEKFITACNSSLGCPWSAEHGGQGATVILKTSHINRMMTFDAEKCKHVSQCNISDRVVSMRKRSLEVQSVALANGYRVVDACNVTLDMWHQLRNGDIEQYCGCHFHEEPVRQNGSLAWKHWVVGTVNEALANLLANEICF